MANGRTLEAENESLRRTVEALTDVAEERQAGHTSGTSFELFDQSVALQGLVDQKTRDLRSALKKLGETQAQLLSAHKLEAVGQLAAGVAHEINTPMQYIGDNIRFLGKAFTRLLPLLDTLEELASGDTAVDAASLQAAVKRAKLSFIKERVPRALQQASEGVSAVSTIVAAMKEFSHPGSKEKQPIELNALIRTTQTVSRNEWKYVSDFELELDPELPTVLGHGSEIGQVILNMVVNAAHAIEARGGDKGTITVRTAFDAGHVFVCVEDTGTGMPESVRQRIFDPFFTTKEVGKGTGQGLSIAHAIMKNHGGAIAVDSEVGRGTTFKLSFPTGQKAAA